MAGGRREVEVAERLGKPVSDAEADGVGTVGGPGQPGDATKVAVDSLFLER
jgi:hypothetical protein